MPLPLDGCKVLDLTRALAGPFATQTLGDLGADVVKVEPTPEGEMIRGWGPFDRGISVYYLSANRNKRSLAVDFRHPDTLPLLRDMAAKADIVIENFKPGVAASMQLSYEHVKARNPNVIYASITGFGRGGPYETWPGVDQIAQGMSGLMSLAGTAETGPFRTGVPIGDLTAGMWAAMGILAAYIQRQATGQGQLVETSLLGSLVGLLGVQGQRTLNLGEVPPPVGNTHPVITPYGSFETQNGPINLAVPNEAMWPAFCRAVGAPHLIDAPEFKTNAARLVNRDLLKQRLEEILRTKPKEEWTPILVEAGIPAGPIWKLDEVLSNEHVRSSGCIETVAHPTLGPLQQLASPMRLAAMEGRCVRRAPPILGEHSREALASYDIDAARIATLISGKAVLQADIAAQQARAREATP